jgi:hypothetical protein
VARPVKGNLTILFKAASQSMAVLYDAYRMGSGARKRISVRVSLWSKVQRGEVPRKWPSS